MAWYQNYGAAKAVIDAGRSTGTRAGVGASASFSYSSRYSEYVDGDGNFHFHHRHFHGLEHEHHHHHHTPFYRKKVFLVLVLTFVVVVVASALVAQTEGLTTLDSLYFTWVTLTTVGYGDIVPKTGGGQATVVFVGVLGLAILSLLITTIADASARRVNAFVERLVEAGTADPYVILRNEPRACVRCAPCMPGGACCFPQLEWLVPCARPTRRTKVRRRSLNPLWNEVWLVDVDTIDPQSHPAAPAYSSDGLVLELELYDYDVADADDRIGVAFLPLADLSFHWSDFELPVVLDDAVVAQGLEPDAPAVLHVSARALPNSSIVELVVIGAANLPIMDAFAGNDCLKRGLANALEPAISAAAFLAVVLAGASIFSFIEGWRWFDGLYWAFVTINAVGFGDFTPTKENSRLLFIPYSIVGLAARGYAIGVVSNMFLTRTARAYLSSTAARPAAVTRDDILASRAADAAATRFWCACCYRPTGILIRHLSFALATLGVSVLAGSLIYLNEPGWTWGDGVYFCFIALSQVGYGDLLPTEDGTKAFVIVYSIIGTLLVSVTIGIISKSKVDEAHYELKVKRESRIRELERSLDFEDEEQESASDSDASYSDFSSTASAEADAAAAAARRREILHLVVKCFVLTAIFVVVNLVGAAIFMELQDPPLDTSNEYGTSIYWSVVTLSTIGYGDVVPNSTPSKFFVCLYVVIGLAYFAFLLGFLDKTTNELFQFGAGESYSSFTSASGYEAEVLRLIRRSRTNPTIPLWRGDRYGERNERRLERAGAIPADLSSGSSISDAYTYDYADSS